MSKKMILVAAGVAGLLVLGGGGFFVYRALFSSPAEESGEAEAGKEGHGGDKEGEAKSHGQEKKGHGDEKEQAGGHGEAKEGGAAAPAVPGLGPTYALEPFVVNLSDPGRPRYAKIVVQLELDGDPAAAEIDGLKPKVRDSLLMLFSSKTSQEMVTVGGKETLRNEVIRRLNALLTTGKVVEAYFTDFVVQ